MISGIINWLTEPDALDRSIIVELERPPDDLRKEETEVEAKFEELRPKLFGYILDVLVKTLQIKPKILLAKLDRMADFEVWGEAIARSMGYQPMEFVDAYRENIGIQNVEALENHLLAQVLIKFVDSWYVETREACWQSPTAAVCDGGSAFIIARKMLNVTIPTIFSRSFSLLMTGSLRIFLSSIVSIPSFNELLG